ncbi:hypothetical protein ElyMa_002282700 [Elysia marginata]|uniref:Uncharacterized protein n=1 Tax=Elysia marginata TaxID=1093978 RepID=A0AAV4G2H6_9GAST|nr:hypothetical protein ElyMa_002282700 [Elysia marginata]
MTRAAKACINKKTELFKDYLKCRTVANFKKYAAIRNKSKRLVKQPVKQYESSVAKECKTNVKRFWKYVNTKLRRRVGVKTLLKDNDNETVSDAEKAGVVNNFVAGVFIHERVANIPNFEDCSDGQYLNDIVITKEGILQRLSDSDVTKSMRPDLLPPRFLKEVS